MNNKELKDQEKREKARKLAIKGIANKFIQTCIKGQKCAVFNRKILRNQLRRFVGNKQMKPVFEYIQKNYKLGFEV